jgi:hypothetical protein
MPYPSNQAIIGPQIIDMQGNIRIFIDPSKNKLTLTKKHLTKPDSIFNFLAMEGILFKTNVNSLLTKTDYR